MAADAENRMDRAERVEWLDHVTEWAHELSEEAAGYSLDCAHNGGEMAPLEGDLEAVAHLARDLHARVKRVLDLARADS